MTHDELTHRAIKWLINSRKCYRAMREPWGPGSEQPDAIGWRFSGRRSVVIECKTSLSDFYRDKKKHFRRYPDAGMGWERWYMTPPRLLDPKKIPPRWGLLEVGSRVRKIIKAEPWTKWNIQAELGLVLAQYKQKKVNPEDFNMNRYSVTWRTTKARGLPTWGGEELVDAPNVEEAPDLDKDLIASV